VIGSEQVDIEEVNVGTLTILGDFLLGVGVVLLGVAAIVHVFAGTLFDDKKVRMQKLKSTEMQEELSPCTGDESEPMRMAGAKRK
jgi:hypothetical protein